jgi:PAS domain S-box-containing protein
LSKQGLPIFAESLKTIIMTGEYQGTIPFLRKDGTERQIAFRSRRMDLPGSPSFVLTHGMDVTEQHEAKDELHLIRHQRELILASVEDGIYGIDLDGKLSFLNPAAAKLLGYTADELRGKDMHEIIHHSHADGIRHSKANCPILLGLQRQEGLRVRDDVFWRKDGTTVPVEYVASPLIDEGQIAGMVVAFQDVSERRRLERMKDEFISTVSHELRTPLTSLRASLGLISSGSLDKRPEKQKQMLEVAIGNCDRLVRLVNDILDFDKVERGGMPLNCEVHKVGDILRRAADVEHDEALKAQITFRFDVPAKLTVNADQERILQVLSELVSNAIKFSPPQTIIKLAAQAADNNEVCIIVEDQGRGIAQENLDMIFERFQQGDASDSRALGGTGLGLAICRRIVQQHGGHIWVESEPGKGSRFMFTMPAGDKATSKTKSEPAS